MELRKGDMFVHAGPEVKGIFVTTNAFVRRDGALVMGRGAALAAKRRFPGLEYQLGDRVRMSAGHLGRYGLVWVRRPGVPFVLGAFQVKRAWFDRADLELIEFSARRLAEVARRVRGTLYLNFPGVGNGQLPREEVWPVLEKLRWTMRHGERAAGGLRHAGGSRG